MSSKITPVLIAIGAVLVVANQADANPLFHFFENTPVAPVPEADLRDLGSVGIGTALMAAVYAVRKAYLKVAGRKRN